MNILVDFHCHIYALYDLRKVLNFEIHSFASPLAVVLTERHDCHFFDQIKAGKPDSFSPSAREIVDDNCCRISTNKFLFRGRQFAAREGIEVLALLSSPDLPDKLPAKTYCEAIINAGGIVAFSWAFGKWRGPREELIEKLSSEFGYTNVVLLDSRLRPNFLALPTAFDRLSKQGFKTFVGSDPLPLKWHESALGSYVNLFECPECDSSEINSEFLRNLIVNKSAAAVLGDRSSAFEFLKDQISLRL